MFFFIIIELDLEKIKNIKNKNSIKQWLRKKSKKITKYFQSGGKTKIQYVELLLY